MPARGVLNKKMASGIEIAIRWNPFIMGIVIATAMGLLLTLPTSSAAIWVSMALGNDSPEMLLAGGAAVVGCAAHMSGLCGNELQRKRFFGIDCASWAPARCKYPI